MSMLTAQCEELRTTAVKLERMLKGEFDAVNLSTIPPMLRNAASTIIHLRAQLTETCHDTGEDQMRFVCSECGGIEGETLPQYCPNCGRRVV